MTARSPLGWQVILADLSLILFIATASALGGNSPDLVPVSGPVSGPVSEPAPSPQAVFSSRMEGDNLADWLASYTPDERERLRIVIHYTPGGLDAALARAGLAARTASAARHSVSVTLEEGTADGMTAVFAFDGQERLARNLQQWPERRH